MFGRLAGVGAVAGTALKIFVGECVSHLHVVLPVRATLRLSRQLRADNGPPSIAGVARLWCRNPTGCVMVVEPVAQADRWSSESKCPHPCPTASIVYGSIEALSSTL
jgi:hypothetical protein